METVNKTPEQERIYAEDIFSLRTAIIILFIMFLIWVGFKLFRYMKQNS